MNIFSLLTTYAGKWNVKNSRSFNEEEVNAVDHAVVVASQYGNSVCFFMRAGGQTYIPLSTSSTVGLGEEVDVKACKLLTLEKSGEADIQRIEI